ncbi:ABC transporter [Peribacillus muralis]|uniref:ABC transporter n=1 Tax=Peribacillus muralis TaxID=264697 RepID=A0A1B3XUL3_9BACI|nr:ABC transporter ATP-binding protein [Peribacillus muralis]AOH56909.1 ABC transporter [Peribacillus muralis]
MTIILKTEKINKYYNNHLVLKSTSLIIRKGEIYIIKGKSGSGKSTFLSIIGGLEYPSKGKVFFENRSFYDLSDNEQSQIRGKSFGFVFQSFQLVPELTVKENIELPISLLNNLDKKLDVNELVNELDISMHLNKKPSYLSGGEQQRVAIARALITCPKILFADEPTGNLDQETSEVVINLLTKLSLRYNISLIIVTHEKGLIKQPHYSYRMIDGVLKMETNDD